MTSTYDSIGLAIPEQWVEFPVEWEAFNLARAELRRRWDDEWDWDRTTQRRAEVLLGRFRRDLWRAGAQFAAMYLSTTPIEMSPAEPSSDITEPSSAQHEGGGDESSYSEHLMATCFIGTYSSDDVGTDRPLTLGTLIMAFAGTQDSDDNPPRDIDGIRILNLEPPVLHDLPLGRSIRLRRLYGAVEPSSPTAAFYAETFLTPLDGGERCVMTHFTTPNVTVAPSFSELFVRIADTVTGLAPDDATAIATDWAEQLAPSGEPRV